MPGPSPATARSLAWGAALLALAAHAFTIGHQFAFDDRFAIVANRAVNGRLALHAALTRDFWGLDGSTLSIGSWRPVVSLLYALEWRAGGGAPWLFHVDNVLLHGAASWLFARHFASRIPSVAGAVLAAVLFAVQAVHADAVASLVGRADVVAFIALMGCTLLWERATARGTLGALGCFALALGAKETSLGWLAVLALWEWRRGAPGVLARWRGFGLMLLVALAWVTLRHGVTGFWLGTVAPQPQFNPLATLHGAARLLGSLRILGLGAQSMVVPTEWDSLWGAGTLSTATTLDARAVIGVATTLGLAALVLRGRPLIVLAAGVWLVPALAVAQLVGVAPVIFAERWWYAPSAGAALLLGVALGRLSQRLSPRAVVAVAATLCLVQVPSLIERTSAWRSTESVLRGSLQVHPNNVTALTILGIHLFEQGRLAEAERALLAAHRLAPGWARPIAFLARTAASRGDLPTARVWMNRWRGASNDQTVEDVLWWVRLLGQAGYAPEAWGTLEWMRQRGLWSDRIPGVVAEVRARLPGR